jgi:hypothetical protein
MDGLLCIRLRTLQHLHARTLQCQHEAAVARQPTAEEVVRVLDAGGDADEVVWEAPRRSDLRCGQP